LQTAILHLLLPLPLPVIFYSDPKTDFKFLTKTAAMLTAEYSKLTVIFLMILARWRHYE